MKVVLQNLTKIFPSRDKKAGNEVVAVNDFNFEIPDGKLIGLLGPSGCGKSTTLRMIAGLEDISEGELYIDNRLVNKVAPKDRDIAMVFQNYALYPHLNVQENIALGLKVRKVAKCEINRRVQRAVEILKLEDYLKAKPKEKVPMKPTL